MPATVRLTSPFSDDITFSQLSGAERLSQPFHFDLAVLSKKGDLAAADILGKPVSVAFPVPSGGHDRHIHGLVSDFAQAGYGERFHEYHLTVRPWFWFLTRSADCRIFSQMTVEEIFKEVTAKLGFSDYRFKLSGRYRRRVYCVQYRETAFNFLSRLLEEEGIYYFFEHAADRHTMVLVDHSGAHVATKGYEAVPYYPPSAPAAQRKRDHLTSWAFAGTVQPDTYATTDFDFLKPTNSLTKSKSEGPAGARTSFEVFDFPAEVQREADDKPLDAEEAVRIAQTRLQELRVSHMLAHGQGNAAGLAVGAFFQLTDYPRKDLNLRYLIVGASYSLVLEAPEAGHGSNAEFHVSLEALDLKQPFRPARSTPKPVVHGTQTAIVVGATDGEVETDKYGRVKVRFHWDRKKSSSCWVRVAQVWAGPGWGALHIPRVGQEVMVSFLEGDPDRPIITGSVYNGDAMPPYTLPGNASQSGIKSRSCAKGGGEKNFNEIRFEDKHGSEELVIHAEKDFSLDVENDASWRVGLDEDKPAKNQKGNLKLLVGKSVHLDAGDEITLETGQSKIVMKKDGAISISCKTLEITATQEISLDGKQKIQLKSLDIKAEGTTSVQVKSLSVKIEGQTSVGIKSSVSTKVEGTMLDLSASGIASLKGALTKIG